MSNAVGKGLAPSACCNVAAAKAGTVKTVPYVVFTAVSPAFWQPVDFYGPNLVRSQGETAFPIRTVALRKKNGYISLIGNAFTELKDGSRIRVTVPEEEAAQSSERASA